MLAALLMVDPGLVDILCPRPAEGGDSDGDKAGGMHTDVYDKIMTTIESCRAMLEDEPPERMTEYWGTVRV